MIKKGAILTIGTLILIVFNLFQQPRSNKLNLIIISIDALRADRLGVYGYQGGTSPFLDQWSKQAFVFNQAVSISSSTYPAMTGVMTGQNQLQTGVYSNTGQKLAKKISTLAQILKKNGYDTFAQVTNENLGSNSHLLSGFKKFQATNLLEYLDQDYQNLLTDFDTWLAISKKPKFIWLHLMPPHAPYFPPPSYRCLFQPQNCQQIKSIGPVQLEADRRAVFGCLNPYQAEKLVNLYSGLYNGEVSYTDSLIKQIWASMKQNRQDRHTIVVIMADHGEGFDHQYYFGHGHQLYQSQINIPLMIYHPNYRPSQEQYGNLVQNTDLFNTLLSLLNLPEMPAVDSISFAPILTDARKDQTRQYSHSVNFHANKFAVIDNRTKIKLIRNLTDECNPLGEWEMYSLEPDPNEEHNLYPKQTIPKKLLTEMERLVNSHRSRHR